MVGKSSLKVSQETPLDSEVSVRSPRPVVHVYTSNTKRVATDRVHLDFRPEVTSGSELGITSL